MASLLREQDLDTPHLLSSTDLCLLSKPGPASSWSKTAFRFLGRSKDKKEINSYCERPQRGEEEIEEEMANKLKLFRNAGQTQRFRFVVLVVGCFVVSMTFIMISRPFTFPSSGSKSETQRSDVEGEKVAPTLRDDDQTSKQLEKNEEENLQGKEDDEVLESTNGAEEEGTKNGGNSDQDETHSRMTFPTVSNYTVNDNKTTTPEQPAQEIKSNVEKKLSCEFSDPRVDVCELSGDIRIPGNSSDVLFVDSGERNEAFRFRPYARKGDAAAFSRVRELTVKAADASAPQCTVKHAAPAVVFSAGGYTGNLFHDFTDVLIPLFLSARHLDGEVQFVVSDMNPWWVYSYLPVFQKLSKFPVIDYDKDKEVHCFSKVVVGLRSHKELSIDPARAPNGYSMVDFAKFLREAFSLERDAISNIEDLAGKKPRILIVARKQSRAFTNLHEITQLADQLGFEIIVNDGDVGSDVGLFARLVNSVDVMLGVHGSGLTNLVFLPPNATVIQVVPWGGLEWMAMLDFGEPATDMKLNYVQYSIAIEESSLIEQYPRDHLVFKDPMSFHQQGYPVMRSTFMDNQNVKLDIKKFKNALWKALERIIQ